MLVNAVVAALGLAVALTAPCRSAHERPVCAGCKRIANLVFSYVVRGTRPWGHHNNLHFRRLASRSGCIPICGFLLLLIAAPLVQRLVKWSLKKARPLGSCMTTHSRYGRPGSPENVCGRGYPWREVPRPCWSLADSGRPYGHAKPTQSQPLIVLVALAFVVAVVLAMVVVCVLGNDRGLSCEQSTLEQVRVERLVERFGRLGGQLGVNAP